MKLEQGKKIFSLFPAADNILQDVDHILEQALVYSRTTIAELSPPALNETGLPTALMWLAERMHKHGLQVKIDINQKQIHLPEDRAVLLFQSVRELLYNVLKHAGVNQANVSIHVEPDGEVRVSVEDLGKGLDAEAMQRALEPGHLGLFAVRERMGAMGGHVELTSALGQGTNVRLVLPACPQHSDMAEMVMRKAQQFDTSMQQNRSATGTHSDDSADNMPISTLRRIRVLLVDDHVMVRKGLHILLASYDRVEIVGEAGDGEEAVAMAERLMPHVVVMDLNMPKLNGIEATRRIMRDWPDIKVIGLSINDELEMRRAMINAGAVASLQKTGAATELYQAICASFPDLRPSIQKDLLEQ
jgi:CheY-like chemotaxis protein